MMERTQMVKPEELKVWLSANEEEIANTEQPRAITINGVEIPAYQTLWQKTNMLLSEFDKLKNRQRLLTSLLIIQGAAIILTALTQLC